MVKFVYNKTLSDSSLNVYIICAKIRLIDEIIFLKVEARIG